LIGDGYDLPTAFVIVGSEFGLLINGGAVSLTAS
jgi:hypothetical protein